MSNPWDSAEVEDPGPAGNEMKRTLGCMTAHDLIGLCFRLHQLAGYFERGSECRQTVEACLEIAQELRGSWR